MAKATHLKLVTALGRRIDEAVCSGSLANAARSVHLDEVRADQRRDARAAVDQLEREFSAASAAHLRQTRRTG
jgi:hypothetical protein